LISPVSVSHVGLLTTEIESCVERWEQLFDATRTETRPTWYASDEEVLATFLPFGTGTIEPIQPMRQGTIQAEALAAGRPAFHLSVRVADIHGVVQELRSRGVWVQLRKPGRTVTLHRGWLDESSTHGVTIELIDVDEAAAFRPAPAAGSVPPPPPAASARPTFGAVALRVDDLEAAHTFYVQTLGFAQQEPFRNADVLGVPVRVAKVRALAGLTLELFEYRGDGKVAPALPSKPGISYVTFTTDDLESCRERLEAAEALMTDDTVPTAEVTAGLWVHARSTGGLVVRLISPASTASLKESP
jgi:catechol 2,3-dioxygenase-like lactoylglutathione lyase family enzyme